MRSDAAGLVAASDLVITASLPLLMLIALAVPPPRWGSVLRLAVQAKPQRRASRRGRLRTIASALAIDERAAERVLAEFRVAHLEERLQALKERLPGGWRQPIRLEGVEQLEQARGRGRGAVLWVANAVFAGLAVKKALHAVGYRLYHLSRPSHGVSASRLGIHVLNPLRTSIEERYVAERVLITAPTTVTTMRRLKRLLQEGHPVSITAGDWARRNLEIPFLGRWLRLATGPAQLAASTGAPLLPVFTRREGAGFTVSIAGTLPPVDAKRGVEAPLAAFAHQLEAWVRVHPELWNGWDSLVG